MHTLYFCSTHAYIWIQYTYTCIWVLEVFLYFLWIRVVAVQQLFWISQPRIPCQDLLAAFTLTINLFYTPSGLCIHMSHGFQQLGLQESIYTVVYFTQFRSNIAVLLTSQCRGYQTLFSAREKIYFDITCHIHAQIWSEKINGIHIGN